MVLKSSNTIVIIGGGAAGFFAAINTAQKYPHLRVLLLESSQRPLSKLRISGGGRCNVTHHCFDTKLFASHYPRGSKELVSLFYRFQAKDTVDWFKKRGVELYAQEDGRMFPTSNKSQSIIDCFLSEQQKTNLDVRFSYRVESIEKKDDLFTVKIKNKETITASKVLLATGSAPIGYEIADYFGHCLVSRVPSLFTFKIKDSLLDDMMGQSFNNCKAMLSFPGKSHVKFEKVGPLLITHWGLSGPAILKLSAFAARELFQSKYNALLKVNWVYPMNQEELIHQFKKKRSISNTRVSQSDFSTLSRRFWMNFLNQIQIDHQLLWSQLSDKQIHLLAQELTGYVLTVSGKGVFKEEFVTAGGVALNQINFKTMESRVCPGLYFAGEIMDVDGITGGFNFQNAWSTAWVASEHIGQTL